METKQLGKLLTAYSAHAAQYREGNGDNARRLRLEDEITRALVRHLAAAGFDAVMVDDGGDLWKLRPEQRTGEVVLALATAVDEAHVYFQKPGTKPHWVFLVYGNGVDLISDHSYTEGDADGFMAAMDAFEVDRVKAY